MLCLQRRRQLRHLSRQLNNEFNEGTGDALGFHVRPHGTASLELLVYPEAGMDNFIYSARTSGESSSAVASLRRVVALYKGGQRPPFAVDE